VVLQSDIERNHLTRAPAPGRNASSGQNRTRSAAEAAHGLLLLTRNLVVVARIVAVHDRDESDGEEATVSILVGTLDAGLDEVLDVTVLHLKVGRNRAVGRDCEVEGKRILTRSKQISLQTAWGHPNCGAQLENFDRVSANDIALLRLAVTVCVGLLLGPVSASNTYQLDKNTTRQLRLEEVDDNHTGDRIVSGEEYTLPVGGVDVKQAWGPFH